jgi:hypothetical protein
MKAYMRTWGLRLGAAAAIVALMGCASQGAETERTEKPYPFTVMIVVDGAGEVVRIDVKPKDGNARIKIDDSFDQVLRWSSDTKFLIKFESMKSDQGHGGDNLGGPGQWTEATLSSTSGKYEYKLKLNPSNPARGSGTYTTKYHLKRKAADTYELDPVVIVDR